MAQAQPLATFHVEICEDLWVPIPPSSFAALAGATLLLNLSASNALVGKGDATIGKKNLVNNYCVAVSSNWAHSHVPFCVAKA